MFGLIWPRQARVLRAVAEKYQPTYDAYVEVVRQYNDLYAERERDTALIARIDAALAAIAAYIATHE